MPPKLEPQRRKILVAILISLLVANPPLETTFISPVVRDIPSLDTATETTAAIAVIISHMWPETKPHPEQGRECISNGYLREISEAECMAVSVCIYTCCLSVHTHYCLHSFTADELISLKDILQIPHPLVTEHGFYMSGLEALALLCVRLCSPEDQWSLATKYARPQLAVSEITNETMQFINKQWVHLLDWDSRGILAPPNFMSMRTLCYRLGLLPP
jgi:hypothetical protein